MHAHFSVSLPPSHADSKCSELDISQAIKMPPLPGQSRSLLQFTPVKQEYGIAREAAVSPAVAVAVPKVEGGEDAAAGAGAGEGASVKMEVAEREIDSFGAAVKKEKPSSPDHDYFGELS